MKFEIYHRLTVRGFRFFWRLRAANHEIIAHGSTRGYSRRIDVENALRLIKGSVTAPIEIIP